MMKRETIPIANIYVPTKRRATLEQKRVDEIAASILDKGLQAPILVRADGARFCRLPCRCTEALNSFLLVVLLSCSAVCRSRCLHFISAQPDSVCASRAWPWLIRSR